MLEQLDRIERDNLGAQYRNLPTGASNGPRV